MHIYPNALAVVGASAPDQPAILNRSHAAARAARFIAPAIAETRHVTLAAIVLLVGKVTAAVVTGSSAIYSDAA